MPEVNTNNQATQNEQAEQSTQTKTTEFDYEKLANIVNSRQTQTEKSVLKQYFKDQGVDEKEMGEAIKLFKEQQKANMPDIDKLNADIEKYKAQSHKAALDNAGTMIALELEVEAKNIPYVLKLADLTDVLDKNGMVDKVKMQGAISKVLEDVPSFKKQQKDASGFKFGASNNGDSANKDNDALKAIFGNK